VYLSFEKLDTPKEKIDAMLEQIEQAIYGRFAGEVSSKEIGETALKFIKKVDQVAYIRFASVYRQFVDLEDFEKEIQVAFKKSRG
jgi:transcriptional repressor NrdR